MRPRPSTTEIYQAFGRALGFVVQKMAIPNLKLYPFTLIHGWRPRQHTGPKATNERCTGNEAMNSKDMFFNVIQLRVSYRVYKAVYATAYALHQLIFCKPVGEKIARPCMNVSEIKPKELRIKSVTTIATISDHP